jgi:hypothetical protein
VRQAGTPNEDNESTFGGYPRRGPPVRAQRDVIIFKAMMNQRCRTYNAPIIRGVRTARSRNPFQATAPACRNVTDDSSNESLCAVRRCEEEARRRRCPSGSATPPAGDCAGVDRAASFLVDFNTCGQYCGPFVEVLVVGDVQVALAEQAGGTQSSVLRPARTSAPPLPDPS